MTDEDKEIRIHNTSLLINEKADGNLTEFAKLTGKLQSYWSDVLRDAKSYGPKAGRMLEIKFHLPKGWIEEDRRRAQPLDGLGQDRSGRPDAIPGGDPLEAYDPEDALADGDVEIPILNVRAGAGGRIHIGEVGAEGYTRYPREKLRKYGLKAENLVWFRVEGDSMDDVLPSGASVLGDRSRCAILDGHCYILRSGEEVQVKYLFHRPDGGIIIRSHNPKYPDVVLVVSELENVQVIGEVVHSDRMWVKPVSHRRKDDIEP
jgi:phage repressor protein C with HTH and peptisase S24 domain